MILLAGFLFATTTNAQTMPPKKEVKTANAATGNKLKKDGTPDMRFKENKEKAKATDTKLKKDGTPDKRFKANKKK